MIDQKYVNRLKQVEYHFNNMQEKAKKFAFGEFDHELCAFIDAARNVTFAMQKECANKPKFGEWYAKKQEEMKKDELLSFFVGKRNTVSKEGARGSDSFTFYLETEFLFTEETSVVGVILPYDIFVNPESNALIKTADGRTLPMGKNKVIITPVFQELKGRHVIDACQEYLDKLNKLVIELKTLDSDDG